MSEHAATNGDIYDAFPGYRLPSDDEIDATLQSALVIVDANVPISPLLGRGNRAIVGIRPIVAKYQPVSFEGCLHRPTRIRARLEYWCPAYQRDSSRARSLPGEQMLNKEAV